jgi:hypothetical protein
MARSSSQPKAGAGFFFVCGLLLGCSFTRYADGPINDQLQQPLPELRQPLARTFGTEVVSYNTAGGLKAIDIGDLTGREMYVLPADLGRKVDDALSLDDGFDEASTAKALNLIFAQKVAARRDAGIELAPPPTDRLNPTSAQYVERHHARAKEYYAHRDYLRGNVHMGAAMNVASIDASFAAAQSTAQTSFAIFGAAAALGEAIVESEFEQLRAWISEESGAVGPAAPAGTHLSVFVLEFFDAKWGGVESRQRVAAHVMLTRADGSSVESLQGSDLMLCSNECDVFPLNPRAKPFDLSTSPPDVRKLYGSPEGLEYMNERGFDNATGIYAYLLLKHGLKVLAEK